VEVVSSGFEIFLDNVSLGTVTTTYNNTQTHVGVYNDAYGTNNKIDNFTVSYITGVYVRPQIYSDVNGNLFAENALGVVSSLTSAWIPNGTALYYNSGNVGSRCLY
jgi:hypothetical protein